MRPACQDGSTFAKTTPWLRHLRVADSPVPFTWLLHIAASHGRSNQRLAAGRPRRLCTWWRPRSRRRPFRPADFGNPTPRSQRSSEESSRDARHSLSGGCSYYRFSGNRNTLRFDSWDRTDRAFRGEDMTNASIFDERRTDAAADTRPVTRPLAGTVALVTGASSGIGASTAAMLAAHGAAVALAARRTDRLAALATDIQEQGGTALVLESDITDERQAAAAVDRTVGELGRLDTLVNNAGVMLLGPVVDAPLSEWQRMVDINVLALLYCAPP